MKLIVAGLVILFLVLQYQLWFANGGLLSARHLHHNITKQAMINGDLQKRNDRLKADINDLKHGKTALEEHARHDLGMIKKDETFYQVVKRENNNNNPSP